MIVIDLYSGMGGLSWGFSREGFRVTGFDINPVVPEIYERNAIGEAHVVDLGKFPLRETAPRKREDALVLVGGPPCKPWSNVNRRQDRFGVRHPDHLLMVRFLEAINTVKPDVFLMENVLPVANDPEFRKSIERLRRSYWIAETRITYSDYGAPTSRQRFFAAGFRRGRRRNHARSFLERLAEEKRNARPKTAGEVLAPYLLLDRGGAPDHDWPNFRTIEKYLEKYRAGKYGWYRIDPDAPAPSFGNIMKTYILPPWAGNGHGIPLRVLSVREAMALMGFDGTFTFPEGFSMKLRYQMVADAVSPVFSRVVARVIRAILEEEM